MHLWPWESPYTHNVISEISILVLYISILLGKKKSAYIYAKEKVKQVFALLSFSCFFSACCLSLAP